MPKHIFFDLDNTLMLSRTEMRAEHQPLFKRLCDKLDVVVISGARETQIRKQIPTSVTTHYFVLGQTGNHAVDKVGNELWKESFTKEQENATYAIIGTFKKELHLSVRDENDLVEHRGAQISYSPIGHNEALEKKYAFDPGAEMRKRIIKDHADEIAHLNALGVDVVPGGTTCFDFFLHGKTKGYNVSRLIKREDWDRDDCVYVGDALFPGGNDETVIGVVPTHSVKNPDETFEYIKTLL